MALENNSVMAARMKMKTSSSSMASKKNILAYNGGAHERAGAIKIARRRYR